MRPAHVLALVLVLTAPRAGAEDARVTFLARQLATATDPRVRAQTALLLGQTANEAAVPPLCAALADAEVVVRAAAANALGDLRLPAATTCLKAASGESDPTVRAQLDQALAAGAVSAGALYLAVEPVQDKIGGLSDALLSLAERTMKEKLAAQFAASFAPKDEGRKTAESLIKTRNLKAYQIRLQLWPGTTSAGLKVEMLIMSYPDQQLKGTWNVKAAGGKPESLIKAMVPRVLDDAAADLEWKP